MPRITIELNDELFEELTRAALGHDSGATYSTEAGGTITPQKWCEELVESELASRRLPYVEPSPLRNPHVRDYGPIEHALAMGPYECRGAE